MFKQDRSLFSTVFLLVNLSNFLIMTGNGIINTLYPLYLEDLGQNTAVIGLIMGFYSASGLTARFFAGSGLDKKGRLPYIHWGGFLTLISILLYAIPFNNPIFIAFIRMIHGFGFAMYFTSIFTWVSDYAPQKRMAEFLGIFGISGLVTIAAGPVIGEKILRHTNNSFFSLFLTSAIMIASGLILSKTMKELHSGSSQRAKTPVFFKLLLQQKILSVSFIALFFGAGISVLFTYMASYTRSVGLLEVSPFFVAYMIGSVGTRLFSGKISDKAGRTAMIIPALTLAAVTQSYIFTMTNTFIMIILGIFSGFAHGMVYPSMNALMIERVGPEHRGAGTGIFNASTDIGFFLGTAIFGSYAYIYGYGQMYAASSITIVAGVIFFIIIEAVISGRFNKFHNNKETFQKVANISP